MTNDEAYNAIYGYLINHDGEIPVESKLGQALIRSTFALKMVTDSALNIVVERFAKELMTGGEEYAETDN